MKRLSRRRFLQGTAAAGASLLSARCQAPGEPAPVAPRGSWGVPKGEEAAAMLPPAMVPDGILDVFLLGGMNPWDTFYVVPEHGDPARGGPHAGQQWWTFQDPDDDESIPNLFERCGGGSRPLLQPYGLDGAGRQVSLGPFVYPLRDRPDILARMRVFVVAHDVAPHQAAVPLMLSGHPRGSRRQASTGAHMARYHGDTGPGDRATPYSYVLVPSSKAAADLEAEAATAVGLHRGSARPLSVRLVDQNPLSDALARSTVGDRRAIVDRALAHYAAAYGERLTSARTRTLLESRAFMDYRFAAQAMGQSHALSEVFTPEVLSAFGATECGTDVEVDGTGMGLKMAAHLLTSPVHRAGFAQVVDAGMVEAFCGGYDTHARHVLYSSRNMVHMTRRLAAAINEPGEGDPRKLDLDRHLVLLTTEMGRTPYPQAYMDRGLDHWPYGFVVVAFGGPVTADHAGLVGAIGEDGRATEYLTPAELRAGLLLGAGIWPFSAEGFAVGDVRDARSELEAAVILRSRVWGVG